MTSNPRIAGSSAPKFQLAKVASPLLLPLLLALGSNAGHADTITGTGWKGTAGNNNWSSTGNWDSAAPNTSGTGDRNLFFGQGYANAGGGGSTTANNDLTGWHGYRMTFQDINSDGSGANDKSFTITGNSFTLFDFGNIYPRIENDSFVTQTFTLTSGQILGLNGQNATQQRGEIDPVSGNIVFSTGTKVDLAGTPTQLAIFGSNTVTFNDVISSTGNSGNNSLAMNGSGTVILGAANTYAGDTFVNNGTLRFTGSGSISSSFIRIGDTTGTAGANINVDGGLTITTPINVRSGSSGTKIIANTSSTTGSAIYSGNLFLDTGATVFANTGGSVTLSGGTLDLKSQTLTVDGAGSATISGVLQTSTGSTSGKLVKNGTGSLTLSGNNSFTGGTTLNTGGTLNINHAGALGTGTLTIGGSTTTFDNTSGAAITLANNNAFTMSGGSPTFTGASDGTHDLNFGTGNVTVSGANRTLTVSAGTLTFGGGVTDSGGARKLTKAGAGTLVLNGAAGTWTGGASIDAGTLAIGSDTALGTGNISLNSGTLQSSGGSRSLANSITLNASSTIGGLAAITFNGVFTNVGAARTLTSTNGALTTLAGNVYLSDDNTTSGRGLTIASSGNMTISGAIANNNAGNTQATTLTKSGSGTLILIGNNTFSGVLNVDSGSTSATPVSDGAVRLTSPGALSASSIVIRNQNAASSAFQLEGTSGALTVSQTISWSGRTNVSAAIENIAGNNALNGAITFTSGGGTYIMQSDAGTLTLGNTISGGTLGGTRTLTFQGSGNIVASGIIQPGTGSTPSMPIVKNDSGTLTLNAKNTYNGGTTVTGGKLLVNGGSTSDSSSGSGTGAVSVNVGATLGGTGRIAGNVTLDSSAFALFTNGATLTIAGSLTLNANVVHLNLPLNVGAGTYTLATYNATGSSGSFNSTPVVDSGSFLSGTTNFITTSGGVVSLVVQNMTTTTLTRTSGNSPATYGDSLTFHAVVSPDPGNGASISFRTNGVEFGTATTSSGAADLTTAALPYSGGSPYTVTAVFAGSGNFTASSGTLSGGQQVDARPVSLSGTRAYDGTTDAAAAILSVGNAVGADTVNVASGTGGLADKNVGTQSIASFGTLALGNNAAGNYTLAGATGSVAITQAVTGVSASSSANPSGYKDSISFTAALPTDATGNVVFKTNAIAFSTNALSTGTATSASTVALPRGTNIVTVEYVGDSNYLGSTNNLTGGQVVTNHPPSAATMFVQRSAGLTLKIALADIVTNWNDVDSDSVALDSLNLVTTNNVNLTTNSTWILYTNSPNVDDQISYTVSDGQGGTATGLINVVIVATVTGTNSISSITNNGSSVSLLAYGMPDLTYVTQRSTNLADWVSIATNVAATNGAISVTDNFIDLGAPPASAYYRLSWSP